MKVLAFLILSSC